MTKKHFEALAREIAAIDDIQARRAAALAVARACAQFNPAFNRDLFLIACEVI